MNGKEIFVSFSVADEEIINIFVNLIKRVSLNQIKIWYSHDRERNGGISAGLNWYDKIIEQLKCSGHLISFLTPNSVESNWLLYESGYADAIEYCKLMPVRFALKLDDVPAPFAHMQIPNISNYRDMSEFLDKLLGEYEIPYDQEAFKPIVEKALREMNSLIDKESFELSNNKQFSDISRLEQKLDIILQNVSNNANKPDSDMYDVILKLPDNNGGVTSYYKTIRQDDMVSDILDEIYFAMSDIIAPYMYLKTWVLREVKSKRILIMSEIQDLVSASSIFMRDTEWEVKLIHQPMIDSIYNNTTTNDSRLKFRLLN